MARADGGVMFNTANPPAPDFDDLVVGTRAFSGDSDADLRLVTRGGRSGVLFVSDSSGALRITMDDLIAGATYIDVGNGASLSNGGGWTNASSRALKHAFAAVDPADILRRVRALPITTWSYRDSAEGRHLGPVAEDFKAAFGLAGDGKSIPTVDADGVALAAIQGLDARLDDERNALRAENAALREQFDGLRKSLEALNARLQRVEDVRPGQWGERPDRQWLNDIERDDENPTSWRPQPRSRRDAAQRNPTTHRREACRPRDCCAASRLRLQAAATAAPASQAPVVAASLRPSKI